MFASVIFVLLAVAVLPAGVAGVAGVAAAPVVVPATAGCPIAVSDVAAL